MSLHPSLVGAKKGKQHRSVLKRFERISLLKKEGKWDEEKSAFGLPKLKIIKIKIKKEKAAPAAEAAAAGTEAAVATGIATATKPAEAAQKAPAAKASPAAKAPAKGK